MKTTIGSFCIVVLLASAVVAQQPAGSDPTVVGQVEHEGFALVGSRGRFYVFGGMAMADYRDSAGTRRIVTLQREDHIQDAKHEHYVELREGHRWAFSRAAGSDGMHGVWIQLAAAVPVDAAAAAPAKPKWQSFQRARKEEGREASAATSSAVPVSAGYAQCCGQH
jgi:hypothetical protein